METRSRPAPAALPERPEDPQPERERRQAPPAPAGRVVALDAFRGFTILSMLLVNNMALDAETPRQLTHAPWNGGIHFADLVFPWFLFIVGAAIPFSVAAFRCRGGSARQLYRKALARAAWLYLLGCLLVSSVEHAPRFGLGVLQLIGLAYLGGVFLYALAMPWRLAAAAGLLIGHWAALRFVPVPDAGPGVFSPTENLIAYLNREYLAAWGLSGLVSVVPTTALVLLGTVAGDVLRGEALPARRKAAVLGASGVALLAAGWLWSHSLPFSKAIWTASYILAAAGWAALALGVLYLVTDVAGLRAWSLPLVVPGSNAIVAYVAPILVKVHALQEWTVVWAGGRRVTLQEALVLESARWFGRSTGAWVYTLGWMALWWLVLWGLWRRRWFLRV